MKFRRVNQTVPNSKGIWGRSKNHKYIEIDERSFLEKFANSARAILVSDDGLSDPEPRTAWSFRMLGWFIDED